MAKHSDQYVKRARSIDGKDWIAPHPYLAGVKVRWHGVVLVYTFDHYAGPEAKHPWDPGYGWPVIKQSAIWAPNGQAETQKLRKLQLDSVATGLNAQARNRLALVLVKAAGL